MISKITKTKKQDSENADETEDKEKLPSEVLVIAQEVKIINALASNDLSQRTKQLKKLRRWLTIRSNSSFPFHEEDFLRIWKGLYYMMWMSDKPMVQEDLAEDLGKLIECFSDVKTGVQFFGAFLKTMCREWFGVDQWRMDKFLMLIRRMMRYMFRSLKKDNWSAAGIKEFNTHVLETILAENASGGIAMHFLDVFMDELAKVSDGELNAKSVGQFVKPFVKFMAQQNDFKIIGHCRNKIFNHLLYQSELGREFTDKYNAWKDMGFPTASIDDLEKLEPPSDAEEENTEPQGPKVLDPRAGNVDVFIPLLPLDGKYVIKEIESLLYKEETSAKSRKMLKDILEKYQTYQSGKFPLGVHTMPRPNLEKSEKPLIKTKVEALQDLENDIYSTSRKLKQLNKKQRKKLLASLNFSEATEDTFENMIERSLPKSIQQNVDKGKKRKSLPSMAWVEEEVENEVSPSKIKKTEDQVETPPTKEQTTTIPKKQKKKIQKDEKRKQLSDKSNITVSTAVAEKEDKKVKLSEWDETLQEGEIEYFIPSKKIQLIQANDKLADIVPNPFAHLNQTATLKSPKTPKNLLLGKKAKKLTQSAKLIKETPASPYTPAKRVKIMLQRNTMQNPSEYIKQIKSSPNVPFDATKRPSKGLLKPNSMPSPINPFYKKKIGLKLLNETL